ncbi:hypothetical protein A2W16_01790 [Candidatus Amesbacteria bacterium RBG_16_48_31]|nr:MAG: hypothetical protein A2W16_01790 [Candidatus Amesbacteria bacterium RBG_16_48_31]
MSARVESAKHLALAMGVAAAAFMTDRMLPRNMALQGHWFDMAGMYFDASLYRLILGGRSWVAPVMIGIAHIFTNEATEYLTALKPVKVALKGSDLGRFILEYLSGKADWGDIFWVSLVGLGIVALDAVLSKRKIAEEYTGNYRRDRF